MARTEVCTHAHLPALQPKVAQKSGPPGAKPPAQKLSKAERKRRAKAAAAAVRPSHTTEVSHTRAFTVHC